MDSNSDNIEEVAVTIRFPHRLHRRVKSLSKNERRSFNSQVLIMLETCMAKFQEPVDIDLWKAKYTPNE